MFEVNMKKKIVSIVTVCLLLISAVFCVVLMREKIGEIKGITYTIEVSRTQFHISDEGLKDWIEMRGRSVRDLVFLSFIEVVNLISAGLILYNLLKNPARLTYEEYKKQAETRRLARQEKKRAALEEKQKSIQDELDRMK